MASVNPNTILLYTHDGGFRERQGKPAAVAVMPGDIVEETAAGKVTPIAAANKPNMKMFALESGSQQPSLNTKAIDNVYPIDEEVVYSYFQRGDKVYARLAASQTVAKGDYLVTSATAGCLAKEAAIDATDITSTIVGIADEAVTTTGAVGRIRIRVW